MFKSTCSSISARAFLTSKSDNLRLDPLILSKSLLLLGLLSALFFFGESTFAVGVKVCEQSMPRGG